MRVLHITPALFARNNGLAAVVASCATGQAEAGLEVTVATVDRARCDDETLIKFKVIRGQRSRMPGLHQWHSSHDLRQNIVAELSSPPDVVHMHGLWLYPQYLGRCLAAQWGCPYVITLHGMLEPWGVKYHAWRKRLSWWFFDKKTLNGATAVVATADTEAENIRLAGVKVPLVVIAPDVGFDGDFKGWQHNDNFGRKKRSNNGASHKKQMLFMSRLHPSKGLMMLVEAIAQLRPTDWHITVAGPDELGHRQAVEDYARRCGVSDWFEFIGDVQGNDKWSLLPSADLFVLPSHSENFGLVVAEALYVGVPVVTTSATPWKKMTEYKCGWICQPEVADLTRVLGVALKCSDGERREMGARGARWVREEFAEGRSVAKHVELYERVVGSV